MWAPAARSSRSAPARRSVSEIGTTDSSGANRVASVAQFATTLAGATTRKGAMSGFCSDMANQCQRLDGLAQTHVVGEDPTEAMGVQGRQPGEPVGLIRPQLSVQAGRQTPPVARPAARAARRLVAATGRLGA